MKLKLTRRTLKQRGGAFDHKQINDIIEKNGKLASLSQFDFLKTVPSDKKKAIYDIGIHIVWILQNIIQPSINIFDTLIQTILSELQTNIRLQEAMKDMIHLIRRFDNHDPTHIILTIIAQQSTQYNNPMRIDELLEPIPIIIESEYY